LSTHYIGEQKLSLVTGSKLGCHVLSLIFSVTRLV